MTEPPAASVVVCTYNRAGLLRANMDALLTQDAPSYEVVYVDDGSVDETPAVLEAAAEKYAGRLRHVRTENRGPGPARNAGVNAARGAFILFTDDDAVAPGNWVSGMLTRRAERGWDVLCGGIEAYALDTRAEQYLHHRMQTTLGPRAKPLDAAPTGNLLLPRELFHKAGGFSKERLPAAEDWEFSYRLRAAGASIGYDPAVAVRHRYQRDWAGAVRRVRRMGEMGVYVCGRRYRSVHAYVAYTALRSLASPLWAPFRYPLPLYGAAVRMEAAFCAGRITGWRRYLAGRGPSTG